MTDTLNNPLSCPGRGISTSRTIYTGLSLILAILFAGMFYQMPMCADDRWYTYEAIGKPGSLQYFMSIIDICLDHWKYDTGRLANMFTAPFLGLLPRWVYALVSGSCMWVIYLTGIKLSRCGWLSVSSAGWIAVVTFVIPWLDYLFTIVYASNYIWASALGLTYAYIFTRPDSAGGRKPASGYIVPALLGYVTGWWHEGLSAPLLTAIAVWTLLSPEKIDRRRIIMILALIAGLVTIFCMPAFRAMTDSRESNLIKSVFIETLVNIVPFNCLFYLQFIFWIIAVSVRKYRERLFANRARLASLTALFTFGVTGTAIYLMYYNGPRTGIFNQLASAIACIVFCLEIFRIRFSRRTGIIAVSAVAIASAVNLVYSNIVQCRLTREYEEVIRLYEKAEKQGREYVFFNASPVSIGLDMLKPSYMVLNTKYGLQGIELIPESLEHFSVLSPETKQCSDSSLFIYDSHIVTTRKMSETREEIMLSTAGQNAVRSRLRHRQFVTAAGDSCSLIIPNAIVTGQVSDVTDARFVRE